jgi:chromosome partitioning protein
MILVIGGTKGGSGKTMLATHLAVLRSTKGQDVLLIDADEQGSAMDFTRQRQQRMKDGPGYTAIQTREADVAVQVRQMAQKYDDIIIDVGGRDTASQRVALAVAETLLIPFSPTSVDLWTADTVVALLKDARPFNPSMRAYAVLNKAFSRGNDNIEAVGSATAKPSATPSAAGMPSPSTSRRITRPSEKSRNFTGVCLTPKSHNFYTKSV